MSAGDVVCTGWLIKSPPEKKLKRFTWRKRWFVLRRGRMSGNPDVLEYYQSATSRRPIRTIDLRECEVHTHPGGLVLKRSLHQKFPFVVKTSARVFYLVAKTEQEMNVWMDRIGQICQCGAMKDGGGAESSDEGFPHTPTTTTTHSSDSVPSHPQDPQDPMSPPQEAGHPLDYLLLSQCETGQQTVCISRCESFSTSESSLELRRSSDPEDGLSSYSFSTPPSNLPLHGHAYRPPLSAPGQVTLDPAGLLPSILPRDSSPSVFPFDEPFRFPPSSSSSSSSLCSSQHPAPRLPPKPSCHQSQAGGPRLANELPFLDHSRPIPRRISFSGTDHVLTGHGDPFSLRNKRLSLNLSLPQHPFSTSPGPSCELEPYVPMSSPLANCSLDTFDGYLPMRSLVVSAAGGEAPGGHSPLRGQQDDVLPPPVHRHLKPRQRARPPPLDLRGLSTITEFPTRPLSGLGMTFSGDTVDRVLSRPTYENEDDLDTDDCYSPMEHKSWHLSDGATMSWTKRSNIDYLSLDFNSASPSPVQKQKALLADEHKVDYVQVDEKKTQALQSTRLEWTDRRPPVEDLRAGRRRPPTADASLRSHQMHFAPKEERLYRQSS